MGNPERGAFQEKNSDKDLLIWHDMTDQPSLHLDVESGEARHGFVFAGELITAESPKKFEQRLQALRKAINFTLRPTYPDLNRYNVPILAIDGTVLDKTTRTKPYNRLLIAHRRDIADTYPMHINDIMHVANGAIGTINNDLLWKSRKTGSKVNYEASRLAQFPSYPVRQLR